tara:strand:- start:69 stop:557 length:489 start_codon:yes stop_codon:yes gene_type:complete
MAFKLDGKTLPIDVPFTSNGVNYPANWLRLTSLSEKNAIGITEVADEAIYDQRFYLNASTAKDLAQTKTTFIDASKATANSLLSTYDWQVTRKSEKGTAIDSKVVTYRDNIRTTCNTRETEINNCSDIPALKTLIDGTFDGSGNRTAGITLWPVDPYAPTIG